MSVIIFKFKDGYLGILTPSKTVLEFATIHQIAKKDIPHGLPYKIVEDSFIPIDRTYRDAWEWDNNWTPDGFGGESEEFDEELLKEYYSLRLKNENK